MNLKKNIQNSLRLILLESGINNDDPQTLLHVGNPLNNPSNGARSISNGVGQQNIRWIGSYGLTFFFML